MAQMFDKTHDQIKNWRWHNPCAFGDQVDRSNPQTTSSGKVKRNSERFPWYGCDDPRAKIELPSCRQHEPTDFLAVRPLHWAEILDEDDDAEDWADPGAPIGGRSRLADDNVNDGGEGEEDMQGGEIGTRQGKGTKDRKGKWKVTEDRKGKGEGRGKGNGTRNSIVKPTPCKAVYPYMAAYVSIWKDTVAHVDVVI